MADENRNLNRQQHTLNEEAGRLKDRCKTLYCTEREIPFLPQRACMSGFDLLVTMLTAHRKAGGLRRSAVNPDPVACGYRCDALKQAISKVNLDLAGTNAEARKLSAEIVEVGDPSHPLPESTPAPMLRH